MADTNGLSVHPRSNVLCFEGTREILPREMRHLGMFSFQSEHCIIHDMIIHLIFSRSKIKVQNLM